MSIPHMPPAVVWVGFPQELATFVPNSKLSKLTIGDT